MLKTPPKVLSVCLAIWVELKEINDILFSQSQWRWQKSSEPMSSSSWVKTWSPSPVFGTRIPPRLSLLFVLWPQKFCPMSKWHHESFWHFWLTFRKQHEFWLLDQEIQSVSNKILLLLFKFYTGVGTEYLWAFLKSIFKYYVLCKYHRRGIPYEATRVLCLAYMYGRVICSSLYNKHCRKVVHRFVKDACLHGQT